VSPNLLVCMTDAGSGTEDVTVETNAGVSDPLVDGFTFTDGGGSPFTSASLVSTATLEVAPGAVSLLIEATVAPGTGISNVRGEVGYGPVSGDPDDTAGWHWFPAIITTNGSSSDTWGRALVITTEGTYQYAARFSDDGVSWEYTSNVGTIVVSDE
jgi:hypothetical protein